MCHFDTGALSVLLGIVGTGGPQLKYVFSRTAVHLHVEASKDRGGKILIGTHGLCCVEEGRRRQTKSRQSDARRRRGSIFHSTITTFIGGVNIVSTTTMSCISEKDRSESIDLGDDEPEEEDEDERRNRNRERNKEHARKTRIRKKEQLQKLKDQVHELEEEGRRLKQEIEDCSVASILLGLSAGSGANVGEDGQIISNGTTEAASTRSSPSYGETLSGGKRKRFLSLDGADPSPSPMELNIKGQVTLVGGSGNDGKTQMNWKTGVYFDEQGKKQQLTKAELEELR